MKYVKEILAVALLIASTGTVAHAKKSNSIGGLRYAPQYSSALTIGTASATFTPISFSHINTANELTGRAVGKLETNLPQEITGLPAGKYQLYVSKTGGAWHAYFRSAGKKVAEYSRVEVLQEKKPIGVDPHPELGPLWHVCVYDHWICIYK